MSTGNVSRQGSRSLKSSSTSNSIPRRLDSAVRQTPPPPAFTPENRENALEPCAATASFLLYAQRSRILVLHHDTLTIERRFDLHREDVLWIAVDNVSERGSGRLAVSFDAGNTAIVWDILSGGEVARFSAYEHMRVATFMRNGNIAFGNDQGNIILFEPGTSEHISARTIFDPITAIAPAHDCRTFAIGYLNGSILIATLQPSFTILHTLNTNRSPSRITGLGWHGSSSKQKTDMLATQTQDGDLRVWSVPKTSHSEPPTIIRVLQRSDVQQPGPCWFAWSKNGRLVQLADGETRAWDVRTKKVTYDIIPTIEGVVGISNYGPTATLFTLGRNHTVQQYDINPNSVPLQVANAQHAPANTPPTPPTTLEDRVRSTTTDGDISLPVFATDTESSADESGALSPLQKIAREMDSLDALESEIRDKVMPLSPSSHGGSVSSRSSGKAARRQQRKYLYDRPDSSRTSSSTGYDGTEFSFGASSRVAHESAKSISSFTSGGHRHRSSNLRKEIMRSPQESKDTAMMDLFPFVKARLREVAFRTPHYGDVARTPELLQREMLSVVFGWNDDIRSLIQEELSRQRPGSASAVLLSKWLGDMGADDMASLIGSESMTSSDWMLLALSSIGSGSQKKVGETFVIRLLEKGDVHPAVAILLGLGEVNDAIEVYVSQNYPMEAVLLTCLTCPSDWGRTSYLLRKWGEHAVMNGEAELAVRCFSCTSIETTGPWTSPRAQDAVFSAREQMMQPLSAGPVTSPTFSSPSIGSGRMTTKNAALKLITTFGDKGAPVSKTNNEPLTTLDPATVTAGVTPIINSALPLSPGAIDPWRQRSSRMTRDPSSARTATPGGVSRRKRLPSRGEIERAKQEAAELATTPLTAARDFAPTVAQRTASRTSNRTSNSKTSNSRRTSSVNSLPEPTTALKPTTYDAEKLAPRTFGDDDHLPSPAQGVFARLREDSRNRNLSKERNLDQLTVEVMNTAYSDAPETGNSLSSPQAALKSGTLSPPLTGGSSKASARGRPTDEYISSVDEARIAAKQERAESRRRGESRKRGESRSRRAGSRMRDASETRGRGNVRYIKPAKRSPSSPVPMSPEEIAQASQSQKAEPATTDDESFYKVGLQSPVESHRSGKSGKSGRSGRSDAMLARRQGSMGTANEGAIPPRSSSRTGAPTTQDSMLSADHADRGRSDQRTAGSAARSPSSPLPLLSDKRFSGENDDTQSDGQRFRLRSQSASRRSGDNLQSRRQASRDQRDRSTSRKPMPKDDSSAVASDVAQMPIPEEKASDMSYASGSSASLDGRRRGMSRKELAAKELEERRRSLARRPSAPQIPLPGEVAAIAGAARPQIGQRSYTELGDSPTSYMPPMSRSHTVDPDAMSKYNSQGRVTGMSTPSAPIGLPATPRAMRHPRYMTSDPEEREQLPPVPDIPGKFSDFGSFSGSSLSGVTGSNMSDLSSSIVSGHQQKSSLMSSVPSRSVVSETDDSIGPLLPSTVFSQKGSVRSASAPPEHVIPVPPPFRPVVPSSTRRLSHVRKISPPELNTNVTDGGDIASIDAALHGSDTQVVIIPEEPETTPAILPELQHLAMPPPPPPPPMFPPGTGYASGVINIAMDEKSPMSAVETHAPQLPMPMERASTASPSSHRRNMPSGSGETFSARIRGIGDRMRSSSKNRTKSPPQEYKPAPYESIQPPFPGHHRRESLTHRAQSPYEQAMAAQNQPISPSEAKLNETSIPPSSLPGSRSASAMAGGYRNPKEIRANMPPDTLQQGVYPGSSGFL